MSVSLKVVLTSKTPNINNQDPFITVNYTTSTTSTRKHTMIQAKDCSVNTHKKDYLEQLVLLSSIDHECNTVGKPVNRTVIHINL